MPLLRVRLFSALYFLKLFLGVASRGNLVYTKIHLEYNYLNSTFDASLLLAMEAR